MRDSYILYWASSALAGAAVVACSGPPDLGVWYGSANGGWVPARAG